MPDFNIKNNPVFKNTMRKLETSDRAHANVFNALFETLLDNDNSLKKTLEKSGEDVDEKIDSKGGDISKTKVGTIKESSAEFPIPEKDDTQETLWGKLKKWQQDCLAKFGNYVLTSMITNQHLNDTNRVPSSALVYLMQQAITQLNMDLEGKSDASHYHDRVMVYNGYPHIAGISYITTDKFTIPKIIIDETVMDLIRNTTQTEAKINDIAIDWSTAPWRLKVNLWINGVTYTRYINFTN